MSTHTLISIKRPARNKRVVFIDFDWTIVRPKESRIHAKDKNDWRWLYTNVKDVLHHWYHRKKYAIIVVTNQTKAFKLDMIDEVMERIDVPIRVVVGHTIRKPDTSLLDFVQDDWREYLDLESCFMVGDAAGRPGDWSDMDAVFASNAGIGFKTPEEFYGYNEART